MVENSKPNQTQFCDSNDITSCRKNYVISKPIILAFTCEDIAKKHLNPVSIGGLIYPMHQQQQ